MIAAGQPTTVLVCVCAVVCWAVTCPTRQRALRRPVADGVGKQSRSPGRRRRPLRRSRHTSHLDQQFADAVDLVLLAIRCGHLPLQAMRLAADRMPPATRPAFDMVDQRVRDGQRFADALAALPEVLGPHAHALADAFAAADRDGLPLAPVLERLAAEARHDRRRRADARARQLPVRLAFPLVLCTLPSFVLLAVAPLLLAALHTIRR